MGTRPASSLVTAPIRGSVFGYQIQSQLTLNYLRSGSVGSPLIVEEALSRPPDPAGQLIAGLGGVEVKHPGFVDVYGVDGGYAVEVDYAGWFHVQPNVPSLVIPKVAERSWLEAIVWGLPTALCLIERGDLVMHAAAVEVDGTALVLAAPGGHGKSTLCLGFAQRDFRILAEDLTCISVTESPMVRPGPGVLRIRRDVAAQVDIDRFTVVAEDLDKLHLRVPILGTGASVPLAMLVFLRHSDREVRAEPVPLERTIPDLWRLGLNMPNDRGRADLLEKLAALAAKAEVWNMHRPLNVQDLDRTIDSLVALCRRT